VEASPLESCRWQRLVSPEDVVLHGSINHLSITVSKLEEAMAFFGPVLEFLGFTRGEILSDDSAGTRLTVNINHTSGVAFNVWEAKPGLADHAFEVYEPGLHHVAFNVARREQVDQLHELVTGLGAPILAGPGEFPYAEDGLGYYAVYFLGPDRLKLECVHMPGLERAFREKGLLEPQAES
jgi:catechol 2,3-dioxygenase-like lactoylglutathione lyase family enzyme